MEEFMKACNDARRRERRGVTPIGVLVRVVIAVVSVAMLTSIFKIDKHKWEVPHQSAARFMSDLPECPENWGSFPLYEDSGSKRYRPREVDRLFSTGPGGQVTFNPPNGQLPLSGPQTSIPEFNDCQKFISRSDPGKFDSLYAIFAAFQVDSVTRQLGWHTLAWSSNSPNIVTVSSTGQITAVAAGIALVTAQSMTSATLKAVLSVTVVPGPPSSGGAPVYIASTPAVVITTGSTRQAFAEFGTETPMPRAAATIYTYGPGYDPLGIGPNFSCLFVFFDQSSKLRARMVKVGDLQSVGPKLCIDGVNPFDPNAKDLDIRRTVVDLPTLNQDSLYPAVARWDWDPKTQKHYIGITCGEGWCEIGEPGFVPAPSSSVVTASSEAESKVLMVKGWHDQQILAFKKSSDSELVPSNLSGTVIPNPDLAAQPWSQTGPGGWHLAAYVILQDLSGVATAERRKYLDSLNLSPVSPGTALSKANRLSYCYGTKEKCVLDPTILKNECESWVERVFFNVHRWWVKIDAASGGSNVFCVTRRSHPDHNYQIPATARWRWILKDDSIWTECIRGCCQTGGE